MECASQRRAGSGKPLVRALSYLRGTGSWTVVSCLHARAAAEGRVTSFKSKSSASIAARA
jgi:hypothetical protein